MTTSLDVAPVPSADSIARETWSELCPPEHPFLNADFFSILERHGAAGEIGGWSPRHLVATRRDGTVAGFMPLYLRTNSHGEFLYDWSWASAYRQLGKRYYPKLLTGLPHTPAAGPRLLVAPGPDAPACRRALIAAAMAMVEEHHLSSWHIAFPAEPDAGSLQAAGLLVSHDVQFHWLDAGYGDFDGYLAAFSSEKRRKVKAERRRVRESGLVIEVQHGDEIDPGEWPVLQALYAATFEKFGNYPAFNARCFAELAAALGRKMVLFIARDRGEPVAVSICFRSREALYGRYWGAKANYHSLHFELCFYQGIAYCLDEGIQRFEPGAGGEHKIARGFTPTVVRSLHWLADPVLRRLIGQHLERQRQGIGDYRDEAAEHLPFRSDMGAAPE